MALKEYAAALDPTKGDTLVEKVGPLLLVIVWLGLTVMTVLHILIKPDEVTTSTVSVLGALAGGYLHASK